MMSILNASRNRMACRPRIADRGTKMNIHSGLTGRFGIIAAATLAVFAAGCGAGAPAPTKPSQAGTQALRRSEHDSPPSNFEIKTLSNRADLNSDGDALVEVQVPRNVPMNEVRLTLNGRSVEAGFVADAHARTLRGVLTGLRAGRNLFVADADADGEDEDRRGAEMTITNHPRGGPVLLGSQTTPWICATPVPVPESGDRPASNASGLTTTAVDAQCNIATEYKLFYRTTTPGCSNALPDPSPPAPPPTNNCFKPYAVGSTPPDLATTTTTTGLTVPYIVRVERGTLNRGIYDIAVLFDPARPWTA